MTDKKAREDEDLPVDVLNVVGEDGLIILMQMLNNMCETGECPKDCTDVTMIILNKESKATKCSEYCTIILIPYTDRNSSEDL